MFSFDYLASYIYCNLCGDYASQRSNPFEGVSLVRKTGKIGENLPKDLP